MRASDNRAPSVQAVHAQLQRQEFDKRPVPAYVGSGRTVSGNAIGNVYDGRYNRSHLVQPAHMCAHKLVQWTAAREDVWFPHSMYPALSRVPHAAAVDAWSLL